MDLKFKYTEAFLKAANQTLEKEEVEKYKKVFWQSFRNKKQGGLRLTEAGFDFLIGQTELKSYEIKFPSDFKITGQILIWLDSFIESPYYINKTSIFVFKERAALELHLFSGDVKKFGYTKAVAKRFNQD
jgi:hypothetical protein